MDYARELEFAKTLALEAGKIMRRYFRAEDIGTEWKEDNTPLTVADTAINELVISRVKQAYPQDGVIGEEASFETERPRVWVVDPIDGTMPYSVGIPVSTFSLGLVDRSDGHPRVGVVFDPVLEHMYTAVRGRGASLNGASLATSSKKELSNSYLSIIGAWKRADTTYFNEGACADLAHQKGAKHFQLISQVYSAAKVASGELAGSIFGYGSPWDSAAVSLIVEEAGGIVTDLQGKVRRYDEWGDGCILAANKEMHEQLLELVKASGE